ncbi:hypothetical protein [Alkalibacillus aidingensis]|uniref:hypothetical protein n=1 Tax=Alkalibacillus aidingensis TaxID=2747607 RepID=UPI0016607E83|nr:hypothetical protein [Alkalibacillus aidingensis]
MSKNEKILTSLIVGSIILNLFLFFQLNQKVEEEVQMTSQNYSHQLNNINTNVSNLDHRINQIKEENEWIASREYHPNENSTPDRQIIDLEWSFRELEEDVDVNLLYRSHEERDWEVVEATQIEGLNYRAPIEVSTHDRFEYQIVSDGTVSRSSEVQHVPEHLFRPSPLVSWSTASGSGRSGSNFYEGFFRQSGEVVFPFHRVEEAVATVYYDDETTEDIPLEEDERTSHEVEEEISHNSHEVQVNSIEHSGDFQGWHFKVEPEDKMIESIDLRVEYGDGTVHEGEIFPHEGEYHENIGY